MRPSQESPRVTALERLFRLEVEFHRRLRTEIPRSLESQGLHTSYALQSGYEYLIQLARAARGADLEALKVRCLAASDARDVLAAQQSLVRILGIGPLATACKDPVERVRA
jgi:hypothetical protein